MNPSGDVSTWDNARRYSLARLDEYGEQVQLERGVSYFILALERLGAKTLYSCEGHPRGFYIAFRSSYKLARRIEACGYFSVEIFGRRGISQESISDGFIIRVPDHVIKSERRKRELLRHAAEAWQRGLFKSNGQHPEPVLTRSN